MKILRKIIAGHMSLIAVIVVSITLIATFFLEILGEQNHARQLADRMFYQIEQVLEDNQKDLENVEKEYRQNCLHNAETIAYIIQHHPEIIKDIEELERIATFTGVDEIHVFDETGRIYAGTHPNHYGMTMEDGEQIGFFKTMLTDKTLELCQDMTLNTAENKMMQYSAIWSDQGDFIVQIGMEPISVMEFTEKNELSYIFSLLKVNVGADYYAIDAETGQIVGSSKLENVGKHLSEIGFDIKKLEKKGRSFHSVVNGIGSYCVFEKMGENYIGRIVSNETLYEKIPTRLMKVGLCMVLIAVILVLAVTRSMNRHVVSGIYAINEKLRTITRGNFEESINVNTSTEFSELSGYINDLLKRISSLLKEIKKERDYDPLTEIYNRRGFDNQLERVFADKILRGYCATVMIDADGLKTINDEYGHEKGDIYLRAIARALKDASPQNSIVGRQGGDEFVVFLYDYENRKSLLTAISKLEEAEKHQIEILEEGIEVPLRFSVGYEIEFNPSDYREMFRRADEKMYVNKRKRKSNMDAAL